MVPVENTNHKTCRHRKSDRCTNELVGDGVVVNDSLQSRWYCSQCNHFEKE
jgi:hypothetical protein